MKAILILAAGAATRMGTPKQLLAWKGSTLLEHAIHTAEGISDAKVFVVVGAYVEELKRIVKNTGAQCVVNQNWALGMGSSIAAGIQAIKAHKGSPFKSCLLMLVDQPLITTSYLEAMFEMGKHSEQPIIASTYSNGDTGVPVLWKASYFDVLIDLPPKFGAKYLLKKKSDQVAQMSRSSWLIDVDTPEDYKRLYKANHQ